MRGVQPDQWASAHTFYKHIGIYAYRADVLERITHLPQGVLEQCESLEQLRWLENGLRIKVAVTTAENHSVDTPDDLRKILQLHKQIH